MMRRRASNFVSSFGSSPSTRSVASIGLYSNARTKASSSISRWASPVDGNRVVVKGTTSGVRGCSTATMPHASKRSKYIRAIAAGSVGGVIVTSFAFLFTDIVNAEEKAPEQVDAIRKEQISSGMAKIAAYSGGKLPIYRVVLTGGPCGGKSTALAHIQRDLTAMGFRVYCVPEGATLLLTGGAIPDWANQTQLLAFQANLMKLQAGMEDSFKRIAESIAQPAIILCDRGAMDCSAYMPKQLWELLLEEENWNVAHLRDKRYDMVIHLVTAADGAEKFYTTENNTARTEGLEQAKALDKKIMQAWVGHQRLVVIDNSTDFKKKISRVVGAICHLVGAPQPATNRRRFLIKNLPPKDKMPVPSEEVKLETRYLKPKEGEETTEARITKRTQHGTSTYGYSILHPMEQGNSEVIIERPISGREFAALQKQQDPEHDVVYKKVRYFTYNSKSYSLHIYEKPVHCVVLELNTDSEATESKSDLPPFLDIEKEVTGDSSFHGHHFARQS